MTDIPRNRETPNQWGPRAVVAGGPGVSCRAWGAAGDVEALEAGQEQVMERPVVKRKRRRLAKTRRH